jgi:hypothetical protein
VRREVPSLALSMDFGEGIEEESWEEGRRCKGDARESKGFNPLIPLETSTNSILKEIGIIST